MAEMLKPRGYRTIDISNKSTNLYSVACNLYFGLVLVSISRKAGVSLVPKKKDGTPIKSRVEALPERPQSGPYLLPPKGTMEEDQAVGGAGANSSMEIKEWQACNISRPFQRRTTGEFARW